MKIIFLTLTFVLASQSQAQSNTVEALKPHIHPGLNQATTHEHINSAGQLTMQPHRHTPTATSQLRPVTQHSGVHTHPVSHDGMVAHRHEASPVTTPPTPQLPQQNPIASFTPQLAPVSTGKAGIHGKPVGFHGVSNDNPCWIDRHSDECVLYLFEESKSRSQIGHLSYFPPLFKNQNYDDFDPKIKTALREIPNLDTRFSNIRWVDSFRLVSAYLPENSIYAIPVHNTNGQCNVHHPNAHQCRDGSAPQKGIHTSVIKKDTTNFITVAYLSYNTDTKTYTLKFEGDNLETNGVSEVRDNHLFINHTDPQTGIQWQFELVTMVRKGFVKNKHLPLEDQKTIIQKWASKPSIPVAEAFNEEVEFGSPQPHVYIKVSKSDVAGSPLREQGLFVALGLCDPDIAAQDPLARDVISGTMSGYMLSDPRICRSTFEDEFLRGNLKGNKSLMYKYF